MIASLARALNARSTRERVLLALLVLVVAPVVLAFTVVLPAYEARQEARIARQEAERERQWYLARQSEIAALAPVQSAPDASGPPRAVAVVAPIGLGAFDTQLEEAGLISHVSRLENAPDAGLSLRLENVDFQSLMTWLEGLETGAGYRVGQLRVTAGAAPGVVQADVLLGPLSD